MASGVSIGSHMLGILKNHYFYDKNVLKKPKCNDFTNNVCSR